MANLPVTPFSLAMGMQYPMSMCFGTNDVPVPPITGIDISAVATLAISSDNAAVVSVDTVSGMSYTLHALTAGSANLTAVATWNDGSVGPFTVVVPCSVASAVDGIQLVLGAPVVGP
jgi:hypothetical protein